MAISREQMMQRYQSLPTNLQDAIFSMENAQILQNVGQIHKLRIDQIGTLASETGLVMLGFVKPNEYIPHLAERLKVDKELARTIAHEVNDRIFVKVRDALRKIHGVKSDIEEKSEINLKTQSEASWKVPDTINPQPVLATEEEGKKVNFYEEGVAAEKQLEAKSTGMSQVAKTLERKPEVFKPAETEFTPESIKTDNPPPDLPVIPAKNIFSERMNENGFRSPAEIVEKTEESNPRASEPKTPPKEIPKYDSGIDPYRETV